ncbi:serine/threonine protein kinase [Rivularia sp. UHCC 0363]|uniref:serine/threonine protein kinase n=1 Tax=Rivularia sp. UHCC 0363 TaxID=3110244 RepID=UPI002B208F9D|nr:serine/threonine protein kinase [Rivularia sp. UHCC 0363]MEA5593428.1 serine/threonine protein kinase [Rivularia sp. UHCC 0363]
MYLCSQALYYQVYGLTLRTNQPLPILIPTSTTATADVKVNIVECNLSPLSHQDKEEDKYRSGWYTQQKADGIYHCLSLGCSSETLDVEITPTGKQIWITWANVPLEEVTAILLGCIIGTALRLQGKLCLHSSVIKVDNCAIAIIGAKGAGKSTTAAALAKRGYPILADDIAVLSDCGDSFLVKPGYPRLRLWKSAVNQLYGDEKGLPRVFSQTDKHFVELNQNTASTWSFHSQPLPLAAIYVLGERQQSLVAPSIETIIPQLGLMQLITHRYPQSLKLQRDMQRREFALLGRLAAAVPMRHLHRGDSLAELSEICDVILEDVAELKGVFLGAS